MKHQQPELARSRKNRGAEEIHSAEEFIELRESDDLELYRRAAHDTAPDDVWLDVIARYPDMARWVAHNKTISPRVMEILAKSQEVDVRMTVASKRSCPPSWLEVLAADPEPQVRLRVAYNAKAPQAILKTLLGDPWDRVVEVASSRLRTPQAGGGA